MTCADLRAQVIALQAQADTLVVNAEVKHFPPVLVAELVAVVGQLAAAKQALDTCLLAPRPDRPPGAAPSDILQVNFDNPAPGVEVGSDWTATFVGTTTSFPNGATAEWMPVIDQGQDWDQHPVGASGWVIAPNFSGADVPFTHPFGRDWEFGFAVDAPEPEASIGQHVETISASALAPQTVSSPTPDSARPAAAVEARFGGPAEQIGSEVARSAKIRDAVFGRVGTESWPSGLFLADRPGQSDRYR